jgi:hypothetical protein
MGIGFVLVVWAVVGTVLAGIGTLVLGGITEWVTKGAEEGRRRRTILAACILPFACLGWAAVLFVLQAFVNESFLHRDAGLGDSWDCPLPNGYAITMVDVTDNGWVYNPKTQSDGGVGEQEDAIAGVRSLQVAGRYFLGASDTGAATKIAPASSDVDRYFLLDTQDGKRVDFANYDAMNSAAAHLGIHPELERIDVVYSRYRFTWFDVLVGFLLCVPPLVYVAVLARQILNVRRARQFARVKDS